MPGTRGQMGTVPLKECGGGVRKADTGEGGDCDSHMKGTAQWVQCSQIGAAITTISIVT